ncbi:LacI family DNA-binding transcriptional regulator [Streptomyces kronopolitis]|uniref:LacI family DNA-binding transcriptional regulator n=1 Tax=Streptomyces kronopolitis TaxID=1612435 RepID=UPI0020BE6182|nr:LacI family DNA-binding transcriptional regulator [Streptomyces kronopolitis]MCL6300757.1 LacI family transcriptional regulator [Streptomyces kronopolitis]
MSDSEPYRAVTATDVARVAGVSQSTVSLVLNGKGHGRISDKTVRRVTETAQRMGYRINQSARHLRLGTSGTVLLAVPTLTNNAFAAVHAGAARRGAEHGLGLVVFPLSAEDGTSPFSAPQQALDGVIACSMPAATVAEVSAGVPLVVLDDASTPGTPAVTMDVATGMALALNRLLALGHRRLAHVRADRPAWTFEQRARTFDLGVLTRPDVVARRVTCPFPPSVVRERMMPVLSAPDRPTAVICDDDNMAMGVYSAAMSLGLTIGADLSVIGFNDAPAASQAAPGLTSVHLPLEEMGDRGMRMLVGLRGGAEAASDPLPVTLVERESTGPAPHG